jgi:flagellar basal-body rod modification protein FlgD
MTVAVASLSAEGGRQDARPASQPTLGLDQNAFLKLLVAELRHQDPTKPMDQTELVSQLSALAGVEQAAASNARLLQILDALSVDQATGLIGKRITAADGAGGGTVANVRITTGGVVAELAGGGELAIGPGVRIGA